MADVRNLVTDLVTRASENDRYVLCLFAGTCRLKEPLEAAFVDLVGANFDAAHWSATLVTAGQIALRDAYIVRTALAPLTVELEPILITSPAPDAAPEQIAEFVINLTHELLHLRDARFIRAWVDANVRRIQSGKEADLLFNRFVTLTPNSKPLRLSLHAGFSLLLYEGRGYSLYEHMHRQLFKLPKHLYEKFSSELRDHALNIIQGDDPRFPTLLSGIDIGPLGKVNAITAQNIFEVSEAMVAMVNTTIERNE